MTATGWGHRHADFVERTLRSLPVRVQGLSGGDINEAYRVELADGRCVFVKSHARPPAGMFSAEAQGLRWLAEAAALIIPEVLAVSDENPACLVLEYLEPGAACAEFDEQLGRGLAQLHGSGHGLPFGLDHDNYIGLLPQDNAHASTWVEFYRERRLVPLLRMAKQAGRASSKIMRGFEGLYERLDELLGDPEPASRLHGDLWGGNLHRDGAGRPALIDPAVYAGHREVDLAMMKLFGGFSARCFAAYDEAYPLQPGWEARVPLYQIYPLMVHVNLFGGSYVGQVERMLAPFG